MSEVRINARGCDRPLFRDLVRYVVPLVANDWYELGLYLLDPKYENELDIIETNTKNDTKTCCRKMFSKWLETDKLASWDKLITALTVIGLDNVASDIEQLLEQDQPIQPTVPSSQQPVSSNSGILTQRPDMWDLTKIVIPRIKAEWKNVAYSMRFDLRIIDAIHEDSRSFQQCSQKLFTNWLTTNNGPTPKTWNTLLKRIKDVDSLVQAAEEIENDLFKYQPIQPTVPSSQQPVSSNSGILTQRPDMWDLTKIVIPRIKAEWKNVAYSMRFDLRIIDAIHEDSRSFQQCSQKLFTNWLTTNNGPTPKTWNTLLKRIKDVDSLVQAAEEIENDLFKYNHSSTDDSSDEPVATRRRRKRSKSKKRGSTLRKGKEHPDLKQLINVLKPTTSGVATRWYDIGLQLLDCEVGVLDVIKCDNPQNNEACCRNMLMEWLHRQPNASWDQLVLALSNVGMNVVADQVKTVFHQGPEGGDQIQKVTDNMKARYRRKGLVKSSAEQDSWPPFHAKSFTTLALLHHKRFQLQTKEDKTIADRTRIKGDTHKIPELASSIKLDNIHQIFTPITSNDQCPISILIEGHPGIGKTTLAKEICLQWANNKLLTSDKLLLLLMLRNPNVQKITSTEELVKYTLPADQVQLVLSYLHSSNGAGVTFIIDGFDELSNELRHTSFFRKLIEGDSLPNARVVVTSRPSASACLHQHVDRRIEVLGFEKFSKEQYINDALRTSPSKLQTVKRHFQQYPNIDAICYIPLNMAIIVFLCLLGSLPPTATEMFASFILHTVYRHLKRTGKIGEDEHINKMEHLPQLVQHVLQQLQKVAFDGLVEDKIVFTMDDLPDMCRDDPTCYGLLQSVECYYSDEVGTPTKSFNFLHLGIQEYFAAKYVATLPEEKVYTLLKQSFFVTNNDVQLSNMWIMYFGITNGQCSALRFYLLKYSEYDIQHKYHNDYTIQHKYHNDYNISEDILKDAIKIVYLFQCFQEAQDDKSCDILSKSFNTEINFSNHILLPYQVVSVGFFLVKSHKKWNKLNLDGCHIGDNGINSLHHYLCGNKAEKQEITAINFSENDLTVVSVPLIADILIHLQPHSVLLSLNNIANVRDISTVVVNTTTIKALDLDSNYLTVPEAPALSDMMNCLEKLNLRYNELEDDGAVVMSQGLVKTNTLRVLNISSNNITAIGATAIANSLRQNSSLEVLDIGNNALGDGGAIAFAETITENKTLKELLLYGDDTLDEDSVKIITDSLHLNNTLTKLELPSRLWKIDHVKREVEKINNRRSTRNVQELKAAVTDTKLTKDGSSSEQFKEFTETMPELAKQQELNERLKSDFKIAKTVFDEEVSEVQTRLQIMTTERDTFKKELRIIQQKHKEEITDLESDQFGKFTQTMSELTKQQELNERLKAEIEIAKNSHDEEISAVQTQLQIVSTERDTLKKKLTIYQRYRERKASQEDDQHQESDVKSKQFGDESTDIKVEDFFYKQGISIADSLNKQIEMLNKIDISGHSITDQDVENLAEILQQTDSIDTLDVANTSLTTARAIKIAEAFKSVGKVKSLYMQNNTISEEATDSIVAVINNNLLLQELNISQNKFSSASIVEIVHALSAVNILNISHNLITADGVDNLATGLANCLTLQELDISHNLLAFTGTLRIAQALRNHLNLKVLDINDSFNSFVSEKEFLIDVILSTNLSLTYLNICDRNIRPRFTDNYLYPPPKCKETTDRFELHNLYRPLYFLMHSGTSASNIPGNFIKATETCPFLNNTPVSKVSCNSNKFSEDSSKEPPLSKSDSLSKCKIDSYYVNHSGGTFYNENHDFAIVVPPNAVLLGDCVEIQTTARRFGPYEVPDDYHPISSFYWVSAAYTFKIPVYLIMSHYAKFKSLEDIDNVCVMQACVRDLEITSDGKQVMKEVPKDSYYFDYEIGYCVFVTDHFCSICLRKNSTSISEHFMAMYYTYDKDKDHIAEVCFTPVNQDCVDKIEEQYKENGILNRAECFCHSENQLLYIYEDYFPNIGWSILKSGKKEIYYNDFKYWEHSPSNLEVLEKYNAYPPRFQICCNPYDISLPLSFNFTIICKEVGKEKRYTVATFGVSKAVRANYSSSTDDSSDTDLVATEKRKKRKKPMKGGTKKKEKRSITTESGPSISDLLICLSDVDDWYIFGACLLSREHHPQLAVIRKTEKGDVKECKRALYELYFQVGDISWNTIIEALQKAKYPHIAAKIKRDFC